ncbi:MAG: ribosomal-processing cysteine protease Prp [Lachnospiraceae bacterium]|nr:ribosomal-processing cysteine protease Prp [Lachnospiraceae bacterium]
MVIVAVRKKEGQYRKVKIRGHADYSDFGTDIVCAAVSMLVINTFNSIEQFTDDAVRIKSNDKGGHLELTFRSAPSHDAALLIDSMLFGLKQVSDQYGDDYVTVTIKEE